MRDELQPAMRAAMARHAAFSAAATATGGDDADAAEVPSFVVCTGESSMRALLLELEETLTSEAASELELPYATPLACQLLLAAS